MTEREKPSEEPQIDPFEEAVNNFNSVLFTQPYSADNIRAGLFSVQINGPQSLAFDMVSVFDRLSVLAKQARNVAIGQNDDVNAQEFDKMSSSYTEYVNNMRQMESDDAPPSVMDQAKGR